MESLRDLFYNHSGKRVHKWDHYFEIYERYLDKYKGKDIAILEIGVAHGGSLQLWKKYFGKNVKIYAIDVNPECKKLEEENIEIFIGSQSDAAFLESVAKSLPPLDVIIDDGGHTMKQQIVSFEVLYKYVKDDGVYICEDTHTSYWREYQGGLRRKGTFTEYSKNLIDNINAWHVVDSSKVKPDTITATLNSIHFYDSVIVFEKTKKREKPFHIIKGNDTIQPFTEPDIRMQKGIFRKLKMAWRKLTS